MVQYHYLRSHPQVLIMNNNAEELETYQALLSSWGFEIFVCKDSIETISKSVELLPDVILLDLQNTYSDSFAICHQLKQIESTKQIPIIFVTELENENEIEEGFQAGGNDYLCKPVKPIELKIRIKTHLEKVKIYKELQGELRQKQANEQRLDYLYGFSQNLIDGIPNAIAYKDKNGDYVGCNKAFEMLFSLNKDEIQFLNDFDLFPKEKASLLRKNDRLTLEKKLHTFEYTEIDKSEKKFVFLVHNSVYKGENNTTDGIIQVYVDITKQTRTQRQLEASKEELEKSFTQQHKLISIISHDLRGPIGNIASGLELLQQRGAIPDDNMRIRFQKELHKTAKNSYNLLENLLLWTRADQIDGFFKPHKHSLKLLIQEATIPYLGILQQKQINLILNLSEKIDVFVDSNMLMTVIRNLISNAMKFSFRDSEIIVRSKEDEKHAIFEVQDFGMGMEEDTREKLFDIESRVSHKGTESETGSGFGLKLCYEFIKKNGGSVLVESKKNQGTTFIITLPKA